MIFIDSNIPMYAAGAPSPQKNPCLGFLQKVNEGLLKACSSAEVLQEILHRYRAIGRFKDGLKVYDVFRSLPILWLGITPQDVDQAREFLEEYTNLSSRDALHLAVMQRNKIYEIMTYDAGFLGLKQITIFQPDK